MQRHQGGIALETQLLTEIHFGPVGQDSNLLDARIAEASQDMAGHGPSDPVLIVLDTTVGSRHGGAAVFNRMMVPERLCSAAP